MKTLGKWLKFGIGGVVSVYLALCAIAWSFPELFFYHPSSEEPNLQNAEANGFAAERVDFKSADGTPLFGWYIPPRDNRFSVIVYLHGNAYNIERFYPKLLPLAEAGYGVFMPEYRGFGGIPGRITQAGLEADALAAVKELRRMGYNNSQLVMYGMSLGSHLAINNIHRLQDGGNFAGLILEVPFDNIENAARKAVWVPLPLKYIVRDKYHNEEMLSQVKAPVLVMAGTEDTVVPLELAKNLYTFAKDPKKMIIYQGGTHSGLYELRNYRDVLSWLDEMVRK